MGFMLNLMRLKRNGESLGKNGRLRPTLTFETMNVPENRIAHQLLSFGKLDQ